MVRVTRWDMTQIQVSNVAVEFGATVLFRDITFTVTAGERWGIIGRNGTGKTTLFRLLTGEHQPTRGSIVRQAALRISLLDQHRDFGEAETVWEAAAGGLADLLTLETSLLEQAHALGEDASEEALNRYGRDLERFEREGGYDATARIDAVLHGLGFEPQQARSTPVAQLSGGERGRLGLARELVRGGDSTGRLARRLPVALFHRICTPMHTSRNDESRRITLIPVGPSSIASRSANP